MSHNTISEVIAAAFDDEPSADSSNIHERPAKAPNRAETSKSDLVLKKLRLTRGTTVAQIMELTGWQSHSVRGFLSAVVRKKLNLTLVSEVGKDGQRRYRVLDGDDAGTATARGTPPTAAAPRRQVNGHARKA